MNVDMLELLKFTCPHCFQVITSAVDPSQGERQTYVEDCQVCCRPLVLQIRIDDGEVWAEATPESE